MATIKSLIKVYATIKNSDYPINRTSILKQCGVNLAAINKSIKILKEFKVIEVVKNGKEYVIAKGR